MTPKTISIVKSRREFRAKLFRFFLRRISINLQGTRQIEGFQGSLVFRRISFQLIYF